MKVLFLEIDQEREWAVASLGSAFIGAFLRKHGHEAALLRISPDASISFICDSIARHSPQLLGVSLTSRQWLRAREVVEGIRQTLDIPVIAGGLHATFAPQTVLNAFGFDYVCLGEGELPMLELVNALEARPCTLISGLRNIQTASEQSIHAGRPELHPPIEPIDSLPFMARDLLDEKYGVVHMTTQRGCPYPCTYCAARSFSDLYGSYSTYGRRRSLPNVLDELHQIKVAGQLNYVIFLDDTFTINHAWIDAFCEAYGKQLHIPFSLHARVETVNPEMLVRLANAGCAHITYGVESGSERVRREIMKRQAPNQAFREVFAATKDAGILVTANYIIGTPGETRHDIEQTLALHNELAPDDFGYFVFYPYPGTPLFNACRDKGYLPDDYFELPANHRHSILTFPSLSSDDIDEFYARFTQVRTRDHLARFRQHTNLDDNDVAQQEALLTEQIERSASLG